MNLAKNYCVWIISSLILRKNAEKKKSDILESHYEKVKVYILFYFRLVYIISLEQENSKTNIMLLFKFITTSSRLTTVSGLLSGLLRACY